MRRVRGVALFDFVPSRRYPEQLGLVKGETFTVVEDYDDGWTQVKKAEGTQGVIPTTYYDRVPPSVLERIHDVLEMLGVRTSRFVSLLLRFILDSIITLLSALGNFLYLNVFLPIATAVMHRWRHNEAAQSTLSLVARTVYSTSLKYFLPDLNDEELDEYIDEVDQYRQMTLGEERHRIPLNPSSFVESRKSRRQSNSKGRSKNSKRKGGESKLSAPNSLSNLLRSTQGGAVSTKSPSKSPS